jgi:hypothetical protein
MIYKEIKLVTFVDMFFTLLDALAQATLCHSRLFTTAQLRLALDNFFSRPSSVLMNMALPFPF